MQKSCTGKDVSTRHDNDQLKVIDQLKKRNAQLDFQLRQLQVLCVTKGVGIGGAIGGLQPPPSQLLGRLSPPSFTVFIYRYSDK